MCYESISGLEVQMKYLKISIYELVALLAITLAVLLRLSLLALGWPLTNSDEGTIGMMALHVAYHGAHPTFFYGQFYMGAWEAYLGALFFHLSGPSLFSLRLGLVLMFLFFLFSMYLVTRMLYSRAFAPVTVLLLGTGSSFVLARELSAIGGYAETLLFSALLVLCSLWLALTYRSGISFKQRWWRLAVYLIWGLIAGLGLWSDLLIAPFILCTALFMLCFCWRELIELLSVVCIFAGLVIGAYPLIRFNQRAGAEQDSWTTLQKLTHNGDSGLQHTLPIILSEIKGTVQISIPMMTGEPFCPVTELSWLGPSSPYTLPCTLVRSSWGCGYLVLFVAACALTAWLLWRSCWVAWHKREKGSEIRRQLIRHSGGLMLLLGALLTLFLYASSAAPLDWPGIHARYLIGMLIATPAVIWPLWKGATVAGSHLPRRLALSRLACRVALTVLCVLSIVGSIIAFSEVPSVQAKNQRDMALIHDLLSRGITHIYTDYWTCDKIAFLSEERVICGVISGQLKPSHNRYGPYYDQVSSDPHTAYVFPADGDYISPAGSNRVPPVEQRLAGTQYQRFVIDGYVVYMPNRVS